MNPWNDIDIWATNQMLSCTKKWSAEQWKGDSIPSSAYTELAANSAIKAELSPIAIFHHTPSKIFVSVQECGQPQLTLASTAPADFERVEELLKNSTVGTAAIAPVYMIQPSKNAVRTAMKIIGTRTLVILTAVRNTSETTLIDEADHVQQIVGNAHLPHIVKVVSGPAIQVTTDDIEEAQENPGLKMDFTIEMRAIVLSFASRDATVKSFHNSPRIAKISFTYSLAGVEIVESAVEQLKRAGCHVIPAGFPPKILGKEEYANAALSAVTVSPRITAAIDSFFKEWGAFIQNPKREGERCAVAIEEPQGPAHAAKINSLNRPQMEELMRSAMEMRTHVRILSSGACSLIAAPIDQTRLALKVQSHPECECIRILDLDESIALRNIDGAPLAEGENHLVLFAAPRLR